LPCAGITIHIGIAKRWLITTTGIALLSKSDYEKMESMSAATGSVTGQGARRFVARRSRIHGKGVFATVFIPSGTRLIEYKGEIIDNDESERRYPDNAHTFLFMLEDGRIIDGGRGGNTSRWINHCCDANCETVEEEERVFIETTRDIAAGEEITIDYNLFIEETYTDELKQEFACVCGVRRCRGTLLALDT